ncbi:MAG: L-serine ammonia-lyase [Clostridium sp.]|nr:L-serine ammonia-lyase [Clostridium sp.]
MKTLRELYKIGNGPSSSHTMGPKRAAEWFKDKNPEANRFDIYLYGSLAFTGKGHLTDKIIKETLNPIKTNIIFDTKFVCDKHPNTMDLIAYKDDQKISQARVYSVGGGVIEVEGQKRAIVPDIYKLNHMQDIKDYCKENDKDLFDYVVETEGEDIIEFLRAIWHTMYNSVKTGIEKEGIIPGKLQLPREAKMIYENTAEDQNPILKRTRLLTSYAHAVSENNASGDIIVTAPTCGASGVLPAVLTYMYEQYNIKEEKIIKALAVAGVIGNLVKTNASISGAECGCQAEIGTACSMAAGATAYLMDLDLEKIDNAAEIAMEHHLGLTCDPIYGYVQIPCIERNAVAALRAVDAANMAKIATGKRFISFDLVVDTMYETGKDLNSHYRETSKGGLAKKYCRNKYITKQQDVIEE